MSIYDLNKTAREIIFRHDLAGNITFLNKAGERILGYSRQEACRMNIAQFVGPGLADKVRDWVEIDPIKKLGTVYEIEIVTRDGRRIALEVSTHALVRNGRPFEIEGIALPSVLRDPSFPAATRHCLDEDFRLVG